MRTNTALAIRPAPPPVDPVLAAIERFNGAGDAYWIAHEAAAKRLGMNMWGTHPAVASQAAAWRRATVMLANTRPTTIAGVLALAELIAEDCEDVHVDVGEGGEALLLAATLRDSIAALAAGAVS